MSGFINSAGAKSGFLGTTDLDYEEGEWTASFQSGSGNVIINGGTNMGGYTKIGRMVHVQGYFSVSSVSSPGGHLQILGLPFKAATGRTDYQEYSALACYYSGLANSVDAIGAVPEPNQSFIYVWYLTGTTTSIFAPRMQANSVIVVGGCYEIDQ